MKFNQESFLSWQSPIEREMPKILMLLLQDNPNAIKTLKDKFIF